MKLTTCFCVIWLCGTAGCAQLQRSAPLQLVEPAPGVVRWLETAQLIHESSPDQQQHLLEEWEAAFRVRPSLDTRMRLALLSATGAEQMRDRMRARRLLNAIDPLPEAAADREFISLLLQVLEDQGQYERKLTILWKQVTAQNRRVEELEQQLQALTNIEKNIQSRETPVAE